MDPKILKKALKAGKRKGSATNYLWIDLRRDVFRLDKGKKLLKGRKEAEAYLVAEYGVSAERAKRIIDQGAVGSCFNLNVLLDEQKGGQNGRPK